MVLYIPRTKNLNCDRKFQFHSRTVSLIFEFKGVPISFGRYMSQANHFNSGTALHCAAYLSIEFPNRSPDGFNWLTREYRRSSRKIQEDHAPSKMINQILFLLNLKLNKRF